jgi:polyhydroxybutyrate depolymerase
MLSTFMLSVLFAQAPAPTGCIRDTAPGDHTFRCENLEVYTHIPATCPQSGCGVVLLIHGDLGTGPLQDAHMKLSERGEKLGYILVAPTGGGLPPTDEAQVRIIRQFVDSFKADPHKVDVTGFSRGGFAVWRMACDHSDLFASVAPAAAGVGRPGETSCFSSGGKPARNVPVLMMIGLEDRNVPVPTQTQMLDLVVSRLELSGPERPDGDDNYTHLRWTGKDGALLELFEHHYLLTLNRGGHCIPGSTVSGTGFYDYACQGPNAFHWGEEVMRFFVAHPMP